MSVTRVMPLVGEITFVHKFGRNPDLDTGTHEDIWDFGGDYTFLTSASVLYVSSDNAGDTSLPIVVQGLDANWEEQTVTVYTDASDGRTFVALAGTWLRTFRAYVDGDTEPSGNLYISSSNTDAGGDGIPDDTSTIKAYIAQGINQTLMAIYTVPAGRVAKMDLWWATVNLGGGAGTREADIHLKIRLVGKLFRVRETIGLNNIGSGHWVRSYKIPETIPEKADIIVHCESVSANNTDISAGFDLVLEHA